MGVSWAIVRRRLFIYSPIDPQFILPKYYSCIRLKEVLVHKCS